MTPFQLRRTIRILRRGGIVAYPTEAVWGLGCDPLNGAAIARLLALKQRVAGKGLILIAHELAVLRPFLAPLPTRLEQRLRATWPGPVTWLLPAAAELPARLSGGRSTLAVRVTAHPLAAALCRELGAPLVSTSANPSARKPARSALRVRRYFGPRIDALLPGATGGLARPTEIRDAATGKVLRR